MTVTAPGFCTFVFLGLVHFIFVVLTPTLFVLALKSHIFNLFKKKDIEISLKKKQDLGEPERAPKAAPTFSPPCPRAVKPVPNLKVLGRGFSPIGRRASLMSVTASKRCLFKPTSQAQVVV